MWQSRKSPAPHPTSRQLASARSPTADPDAAAVPASVLDEAFDLADFLRHVRIPFERALSLREEPIDVHA